MDDLIYCASLVLRWLHILAATAMVGGTLMARFAVLPAVATLPESQRGEFHEAVRRRWSKVVMLGIAFLLISGIINFLRINAQDLKVFTEIKTLYHALFGVKFLAALVVFFVASALVGRSAAFEKIRKNARVWLTVNLTLAVVIICISGVMRSARDEAMREPARSGDKSSGQALSAPRP